MLDGAVAGWLGLSASAPAAPLPPPRREPLSREPPAIDDVVPVAGVWIGRFPVTNAAFAALRPDHPRVADPQLADHPVVLVTRADAVAFCAWVGWAAADRRGVGGRRARRRRAAVAVGPHVRRRPLQLRGGRVGLDGARSAPTPTGAAPCGAEQLAGNVWEWVSDPLDDGWGVVRGGSYLDTQHGLHAGRSLPADPARATTTTGFRVVFDERRSGWTGSS